MWCVLFNRLLYVLYFVKPLFVSLFLSFDCLSVSHKRQEVLFLLEQLGSPTVFEVSALLVSLDCTLLLKWR